MSIPVAALKSCGHEPRDPTEGDGVAVRTTPKVGWRGLHLALCFSFHPALPLCRILVARGQIHRYKAESLPGGSLEEPRGWGRDTAQPDLHLRADDSCHMSTEEGLVGVRRGFSREVTFELSFSGYVKKCTQDIKTFL